MISRSRDGKEVEAKKEGDANEGKLKLAKAASSSRQWSAFRNPRIVRVSRTFGGKDRHSKVCTVRGLRDRRIRLSIPTATQLYDLQDKLGLNQPSKVIDWLLDATKNDIDSLPPLQVPQGFGQFLSPMLFPHESSVPPASASPFFEPFNPLGQDSTDAVTRSKLWNVESSLRLKSKEADDKDKWTREENQGEMVNYGSQMSAQKLFPLSHCHSPVAAGLLGTQAPLNSFYHLEASNMLASHGILPHQQSSLPSGSQLVFCQQPSFFPSYPDATHFVSSNHPLNDSHSSRFSTFPLRPFSLSMNACLGLDDDSPHRDINEQDS